MIEHGQRRLAAIMFTDMVGYSALTQKSEALALRLLDEHNRLLRMIFPEHGGREIKTMGDSFLVEFPSALGAAHCAVDIQQMLARRNAAVPAEQQISVRIGLHVGDIITQENDVLGDGVNIASRIEPLAEPGGICVSEDVARQVQGKIDLPITKLRPVRLKNIQARMGIYRIVLPRAEGVPSPAPPVETRPRPTRARKRKPAVSRIRSVAVLPLRNFSRDPEQEYFVDGMTEAVIADLAKIRALKVISRTSVMQYKEAKKTLPQIARELGVDGIVEGSVLRCGNRVRITAQLIHAVTDTHLWAENYERDLQDVLLLQSEVARAIAREIEVAVTPEESRRLSSARRVNPEAYEAYLKGRFHWHKLTPEHLDTALGYYQLALEKDPNYALAYVGIGYVWFSRMDIGVVPPREALPKLKAAALKAAELDDNFAEVHELLAAVKYICEWDWAGAEKEFQRAIQLNPSSAEIRLFYAHFLIVMGGAQEWKPEIERALELDPLNFFIQCFFGWHLMYLRRCDEAIVQLRKMLAKEPNFSAAHLGLWGAFHHKGMCDEALAEAQKFFALLGDQEVVAALERGHAEAGYSGAMRLAAETLAARSQQTYLPALRIARLYAHCGDKDQAFAWLQKAYEERIPALVHLGVDLDWDSLRDDPRFQELLRRVHLSP